MSKYFDVFKMLMVSEGSNATWITWSYHLFLAIKVDEPNIEPMDHPNEWEGFNFKTQL